MLLSNSLYKALRPDDDKDETTSTLQQLSGAEKSGRKAGEEGRKEVEKERRREGGKERRREGGREVRRE